IVSFINQTYAPATTLNIQSLDLLVKKAELQPRAVPPSPILLQRQQELTALLPDWKNAEQSSIFAENFFFDYQVDSLRKEAKSVFQAAGKILRSSPII
ncbi:hypothetical protein MD537_25250, partial [Flavihumibacter sediminis]|nr:hypothetical protein [Flavihumibacter sediminis]